MPWDQGRTTGQGSTHATRAARTDCLKQAGHICQIKHPGCTTTATEAHHPEGLADTGRRRSSADAKLIAACHWCHNIETQQQALRGRNRWKRTPEHHPGLR